MIPSPLLARIPGCETGAPPLQVALLAGGGNLNRCLAVRTRAGHFVLRLRVAGGPRPGTDGARELQCQRAAARAGLAPAILAAAPDASWVLMEHVAGRMWSREDLVDPRRIEALGQRLGLLHGLLLPDGVAGLDVAGMVEGYAAQILAQDPDAAASVARRRAAALQLAARIDALAVPSVLNHGDLSAANLLGPLPMLVDWEYAQRADPVYDVACLLSYYPEVAAGARRLMAAAGLDGPDCAQRLLLHRELFAVLNTLWRDGQGAVHGDAAGLVPPCPAE